MGYTVWSMVYKDMLTSELKWSNAMPVSSTKGGLTNQLIWQKSVRTTKQLEVKSDTARVTTKMHKTDQIISNNESAPFHAQLIATSDHEQRRQIKTQYMQTKQQFSCGQPSANLVSTGWHQKFQQKFAPQLKFSFCRCSRPSQLHALSCAS